MPFVRVGGIPVTKKPGVYSVTNLTNGKVYVGSSACLAGRMKAHRRYLRIGKHDNSHLQRAWFKYGEAAFRFDVIEVCEIQECVEREQYWIDFLKSADGRYGYNLCPRAGTTKGVKRSPEVCRAMAEARKGVHPAHATEASRLVTTGKARSPEVREKISVGLKGRVFDDDWKEKIKATHWTRGLNAAEILARIAAKNRGRKLTAEHRRNISAGGKTGWVKRKAIMQATTTS